MKALVYHGPGQKSLDDVPDPRMVDETDAIIGVDATTICGTDLHILKGDLPDTVEGRILGHEAVGTVEAVGAAVTTIKPGDRVVTDGQLRLRQGAKVQIKAARGDSARTSQGAS